MAKLIRNRRVADDTWLWLKPDASGSLPAVPDEGDVIVPLSLWIERREALLSRKGRTGVWLDSKEGPEAIVPNLGLLPLVAVSFPVFGDGRGFSTARLLRERYGYHGEIRAVGDVLRDQLLFMARCGFDAFALQEGQDVEDALAAFDELPETYQASAAEPLPLFRRRLPQTERCRP
ncbi:MAG: oxidoreductase [Betaproteobacteria bacterium RBG_16_64_9]|nr:MAG: oxidoreductase [Betaproteobacteria bacterium RBG_16_64_9]OGA30413.1 MAG: oxidoreductase [Betaproteobacteria bacterium RIFCSPLOWO2_02_FULL_65_24]OGA79765.1 MAG: oxidoreductase [Betaproteobacteria bacterium RIFCSPLOWO2_12_FULL_66_14]